MGRTCPEEGHTLREDTLKRDMILREATPLRGQHPRLPTPSGILVAQCLVPAVPPAAGELRHCRRDYAKLWLCPWGWRRRWPRCGHLCRSWPGVGTWPAALTCRCVGRAQQVAGQHR